MNPMWVLPGQTFSFSTFLSSPCRGPAMSKICLQICILLGAGPVGACLRCNRGALRLTGPRGRPSYTSLIPCNPLSVFTPRRTESSCAPSRAMASSTSTVSIACPSRCPTWSAGPMRCGSAIPPPRPPSSSILHGIPYVEGIRWATSPGSEMPTASPIAQATLRAPGQSLPGRKRDGKKRIAALSMWIALC